MCVEGCYIKAGVKVASCGKEVLNIMIHCWCASTVIDSM